jgi:hypothetical protein
MRVALLHDATRAVCQAGHHRVAATWQGVLAPAFAALGYEVFCPPDFAAERPEPVAALMRRAGLAPEPADWARLFSAPELLPEVEALLAPLHADMVLGWELSPNMVRALTRRGVPVIDMSLAPLRFAPDLFLRLRASRADWAASLAALAVPPQEIEAAAARVREAVAPARPAPGAALLFVGQTDLDASLIEDGRLAGIGRHLDRLGGMLGGGRVLLLKPHPHGERHDAVRMLHRVFPQARIVTDSIYTLLSDPAVAGVVTLSSSVAQEAPWFGRTAEALLLPDQAPERLPELSAFHTLAARVAEPDFWDRVLNGGPGGPGGPALSLRRMFHLDWGWPPLPPRPVPVPPGDWAALAGGGAGAALLGFGWAGPGAAGVHAAAALATLRFRAPSPGALDLLCTAEGGQDLPLTLGLRPGGATGSGVLPAGVATALRVPVPGGDVLELALSVPEDRAGRLRLEAVRLVAG